jgi:hypothetical protein
MKNTVRLPFEQLRPGFDSFATHARCCIGVQTFVRISNPDPALISTSHVERTNLSMRLFNALDDGF